MSPLMLCLYTLLIQHPRYEFYYDVILHGQYTFHIRDLHAEYGPIIRINPYELHVSDPTYYDELCVSSASGEKRNKWEWYTKQFGTPEAMFSTVDHDQHKARRAALNRFFSMASVRRLQPVVTERVQTLIERLRGFKDSKNRVIRVDYAFAAFTNGKGWSRVFLFLSGFFEVVIDVFDRRRDGIRIWSLRPPS